MNWLEAAARRFHVSHNDIIIRRRSVRRRDAARFCKVVMVVIALWPTALHDSIVEQN